MTADRINANEAKSIGLINQVVVDATNYGQIKNIISDYNITQIYHLAAMLSAKGEKNPAEAWALNMNSLLNVLELAKEFTLDKIYWPSSIAVFGPDSPKLKTPQNTILNPTTVYGISKLAGERWCEYYYNRYNVDIRSLRYPGLAGYKSMPGGGTTDYAVNIYHSAVKDEAFDCFLKPDTLLPMMYMDDAVRAAMKLMDTPKEKLTVRSSYNIGAMSFSPREIAASIQNHFPNFKIIYNVDFRQSIADSWPDSIDDSQAKNDWEWTARFDLESMTNEMIKHLKLQHQY